MRGPRVTARDPGLGAPAGGGLFAGLDRGEGPHGSDERAGPGSGPLGAGTVEHGGHALRAGRSQGSLDLPASRLVHPPGAGLRDRLEVRLRARQAPVLIRVEPEAGASLTAHLVDARGGEPVQVLSELPVPAGLVPPAVGLRSESGHDGPLLTAVVALEGVLGPGGPIALKVR